MNESSAGILSAHFARSRGPSVEELPILTVQLPVRLTLLVTVVALTTAVPLVEVRLRPSTRQFAPMVMPRPSATLAVRR